MVELWRFFAEQARDVGRGVWRARFPICLSASPYHVEDTQVFIIDAGACSMYFEQETESFAVSCFPHGFEKVENSDILFGVLP